MNLLARLPRFGFYVFLAALALAPLLGGTPVGPEYALAAYGGDSMLGVLRALVLTAALLVFIPHPPAPSPSEGRGGARSSHGAGKRYSRATEITPPLPSEGEGAEGWGKYPLYAAVAWVAISLFVHSRWFTSPVYCFAMLPDLLNWLTYAITFALAARFAREDRANLSKMAMALLVGGAICAVIGVMGFGSIPVSERALHRESATFFSPNFAAGFCALTLPLAAALFLTAETLLPLAAYGAGAGLLFALLMITGSRAGLALTLAGLVVALLLALVRRVPLAWGRVGALVAILALFGFLFRAPILGRAEAAGSGKPAAGATAGEDHSGSFRKETWKGTLAMAKANPVFGAGPGTFPFTYPRYAVVGWTGQAHSSYLQLAGESGFPALVALLAGIVATLAAGMTVRPERTGVDALLVPALIGGTLAALGRSVFDSEWSLLGCGIPFFAVLGCLALAKGAEGKAEATAPKTGGIARIGNPLFLGACLVLVLIVRAGQGERDTLALQAATDPSGAAMRAKEALNRVRPPDPKLYELAGEYVIAAYISPNGRRLYQLARSYERKNRFVDAVPEFEKAVLADPNNLQTRKALAEAQERTGDAAGALATYREMVRIAEGPVGKVRAIPELPDTLPAFAYAALAEDAAKKGNPSEADRLFATAQSIIEEYSKTPPVYQMSEIATLGGNTAARRAEVRALFTERILPGRRAALKALGRTSDADALTAVESETTARLDAFVAPPGGAGGAP